MYVCVRNRWRGLTVDVSDVPNGKIYKQLGVLIPNHIEEAGLGCMHESISVCKDTDFLNN